MKMVRVVMGWMLSILLKTPMGLVRRRGYVDVRLTPDTVEHYTPRNGSWCGLPGPRTAFTNAVNCPYCKVRAKWDHARERVERASHPWVTPTAELLDPALACRAFDNFVRPSRFALFRVWLRAFRRG